MSFIDVLIACLPQDLGVNQPSNVSSETFLISGGRVSYNGTTEGAVATYQCDCGYSLSGNVERVCQSDGNWNGQVPQCTEGEYLTTDTSGCACISVHIHLSILMEKLIISLNFVLFLQLHNYTSAIVAMQLI